MLLGWDRQIVRYKNGNKRWVFYVAPCGRRLRNLNEVQKYLTVTRSDLGIDFFNYDWFLHVFNQWEPDHKHCFIKDISYGKESVPISCVNSLDAHYPEYVEYSNVMIPQEGVSINTDGDFMVRTKGLKLLLSIFFVKCTSLGVL